MAEHVHDKIAREIVTTGDQCKGEWDLGRHYASPEDCNALIREAFAEPVKCKEMFRCVFIIGGGAHRQNYYKDLHKDLVAALTDIGFTEDHGAAVDLSAQGTFKFQHNHKKGDHELIVFPRVEIA